MKSLLFAICNCTNSYHGRLQNRELKAHGQTFQIIELATPEKGERDAIRKVRAKFFLDQHWIKPGGSEPGYWMTTLAPIRIIPTGFADRKSRLYFGGPLLRLRYNWESKRRPNLKQVLRGAERLMAKMEKPAFERWLQ